MIKWGFQSFFIKENWKESDFGMGDWEGAGREIASKGLVFRWLERKERGAWPISDVSTSGEFGGMMPLRLSSLKQRGRRNCTEFKSTRDPNM